jgi:hypothetical protein
MLYGVDPDGFEDDFIGWKSVAYIHFGEYNAKMFPCGKDVLMPGEASVQV